VAACSGIGLAGDQDPPADVIFTGTAVRLDDPSDGLLIGGDELRWTFVVDGVEAGAGPIGERITVRSFRAEASCGYEFALGRRYLVRASLIGSNDMPMVGSGSGTQPMEAVTQPPPVEGVFKPWTAAIVEWSPWIALGGIGLYVIGLARARRRVSV
jgi:hypothetical protein